MNDILKIKIFWNKLNVNRDDIVNDYIKHGLSLSQLANRYGVSWGSIRKFLLINQVKLRPKHLTNKYIINENYFNQIDSDDKAYFLGWLFSDGNLCDTNGQYMARIQLQERDRYVLDLFKETMGSSKPIKIYKQHGIWGKGNLTCYFSFGQRKLCDDLMKLGLIPCKSLTLKFPHIDEKFFGPFLRGYIEGDGSILILKPLKKNRRSRFSVSFLATKEFGMIVQDYFLKKFNIILSVSRKHDWRDRGINMYLFRTCHKGDVLTILDFIYKDCGKFYLPRKYEVYNKMKQYIKDYGLISWRTKIKTSNIESA